MHLIYGANSGQWWLAYQSAATTVTFRRSADFATWSAGGTVALTVAGNPIEGRNLALIYKDINGFDVVDVDTAEASGTSGATGSGYFARTTLGATTLTVTNANSSMQATNTTSVGVGPFGIGGDMDANNKPVALCTLLHGSQATNYGGMTVSRNANADLGTSWTPAATLPTTLFTPTNDYRSAAVIHLGAGTTAPVLLMTDNSSAVGSFTNLSWVNYTTQTTATPATVLATNVATQDVNDWGVCRVSATDIHVVARSGANAFVHRRFNGTAWSNGQTIPGMMTGHKAGSGFFLAQDGTDVWLVAIDSGAANKVQALRWTAATPTWDADWSDVETSTATRNFITGYPTLVGSTIGLAWTQANGSNYDIAGVLYDTAPTPTPTPTPSAQPAALFAHF